MRRHGLQSFPSFRLEREGALERLPHESCGGCSDAFMSAIRTAAERDWRVPPDTQSHRNHPSHRGTTTNKLVIALAAAAGLPAIQTSVAVIPRTLNA